MRISDWRSDVCSSDLAAAMCQYPAMRAVDTPLNVAPHEAGYGAYLNYLHFGEATLTFPQTLVLRYAYFETVERRLPQVADDYAKWFLARLRSLEPVLAQYDYVAADRLDRKSTRLNSSH